MERSNRIHNQHLLWRAAFGPDAGISASLDNITPVKIWEQLKLSSAPKPSKLMVTATSLPELAGMADNTTGLRKAPVDDETRKKIRQVSREGIKELNIRWLDEMVNSKAQLREKISLFWHGHFACRIVNVYFQQQLLHIIRTNALGNFGQLLREVSKSPAMLQFLNNQQNRKSHPNENFAREVMELFTLGRGNYTELDVKEAARAFTGWGFNMQGEFVFRKMLHDEGPKTFLGRTGNFTGDDILDILLDQPQTSTFITRKLYRYLVNENADEAKVEWLGRRFRAGKYEVSGLLDDIFTSDWFYNEKNTGNRIKSPIELIAGLRRLLPLELDNDNSQLQLQKMLGQALFFPPNVAGWPGGRNWIDSSTLMLRLQIPMILSAKEPFSLSAKSDDDLNMGQMANERMALMKKKAVIKKGAAASIDWTPVVKIFENVKRESLQERITATVLQAKLTVSPALMNNYADAGSREDFIKTSVISLMSTPEYQLC